MDTQGIKLLKITYDLENWWGDAFPLPDQYLVTIGAKGIGSIYHVATVREVKMKQQQSFRRYMLGVLAAPDLKSAAYLHEIVDDEPTAYIRINGSPVWAWSLYWNKR